MVIWNWKLKSLPHFPSHTSNCLMVHHTGGKHKSFMNFSVSKSYCNFIKHIVLCSMRSLSSLLLMILFSHQRSMLMWSFPEEVIIMLQLIWLCNIFTQSLVSMISAKFIPMCMSFSQHFRCVFSLWFAIWNSIHLFSFPLLCCTHYLSYAYKEKTRSKLFIIADYWPFICSFGSSIVY